MEHVRGSERVVSLGFGDPFRRGWRFSGQIIIDEERWREHIEGENCEGGEWHRFLKWEIVDRRVVGPFELCSEVADVPTRFSIIAQSSRGTICSQESEMIVME